MRGSEILYLPRLPLALSMIEALNLAHKSNPARYHNIGSAGGHALGFLLYHAAMLPAA